MSESTREVIQLLEQAAQTLRVALNAEGIFY